MKHSFSGTKSVLALALAGMLAIGPALGKSDKGDHQKGNQSADQKGERRDTGARGSSGHADGGKSDRSARADKPDNQKGARRDADGSSARGNSGQAAGKRDHFDDRHRVSVNNYYNEQHRAGRCPPGLAKKDNGCMPPGQAKKWNMGQPLPRNVVSYSVPQPLVAQFGQPPAGYRYVRVGSDIVLMQTATRTVVDVIRNLGRS